jgi:hypothetical protein
MGVLLFFLSSLSDTSFASLSPFCLLLLPSYLFNDWFSGSFISGEKGSLALLE